MEGVRRCAACGMSTAIVLPTGSLPGGAPIEREGARVVCQECGASVRLPPSFGRVGRWIGGLACAFFAVLTSLGTLVSVLTARDTQDAVIGLAIFGSISALLWFLTWRTLGPEVAMLRWPIVPGAPMPALRHGAPPERARPEDALRRCGCGSRARCTHVQQQRLRGLPIGVRYQFVCDACRATFAIDDAAHTAFLFVAAAGLSGATWLLALHPPGAAVGATDTNRWFALPVGLGALAYVALFLRALFRRARHPVL